MIPTLKFKNLQTSQKIKISSQISEHDKEGFFNLNKEHFILRIPFSELTAKELEKELEIKFVDDRNAIVKLNGNTFEGKLVDLPNIIESHKTFDSKLFHKVNDISQVRCLI